MCANKNCIEEDWECDGEDDCARLVLPACVRPVIPREQVLVTKSHSLCYNFAISALKLSPQLDLGLVDWLVLSYDS